MTETRTADCGHEYTPPDVGPGYVTDNNTGRTMCYACDYALDLEFMRTQDVAFGWLSLDNETVTTWTGGKLGDVLPGLYWTKGTTPTGGQFQQAHFAMRDLDSHEWHGTGAGRNLLVRLRRVKTKGR